MGTSVTTAISDIVADKEERAAAFSQLGFATGMGLILGPMLGTAVSGTENPSRAYGAGAMLSAVHFLITYLRIAEPLAVERRKPMPAGAELAKALNPLGFVGLYAHNSILSRLVTVGALQFFCEGKCIADLNGYYLVNEAKWSDQTRAVFNSLWGAVMTLGGKLGPVTIRRLGLRGHTTLQNFATALAFSLTGSSTITALIFSALAVNCFATERGAAVRSLCVEAANDVGMGSGEFGAKFANLRALTVAVGPVLYAKVYALGISRKPPFPGAPFFVGALIALLAEALHKTLTNEQLKVKP